MYRRFLTAGAAAMLAAALLLSGCSKKTQTDTAKQTETQTVTEGSTESESSSETAKETQAKGSTKETAKKKAESETAKEKESTSEKNRETQTDKESAGSEKETKQNTGSSETVNSSEVHTVIGTLEEKMLKRGVKFTPTQPDVLSILEKLKTNKQQKKFKPVLQAHIIVTRAYFIFYDSAELLVTWNA